MPICQNFQETRRGQIKIVGVAFRDFGKQFIRHPRHRHADHNIPRRAGNLERRGLRQPDLHLDSAKPNDGYLGVGGGRLGGRGRRLGFGVLARRYRA